MLHLTNHQHDQGRRWPAIMLYFRRWSTSHLPATNVWMGLILCLIGCSSTDLVHEAFAANALYRSCTCTCLSAVQCPECAGHTVLLVQVIQVAGAQLPCIRVPDHL